MSRPFNFSPNEYYHLYNRGTEKRKIFMDKSDYSRFLLLLYLANNIAPIHLGNYRGLTSVELFNETIPDRLVNIGAYCLMPNHFHILIREREDDEKRGISVFMQKLTTAYTMYFNKKHNRTGALFQGTFKARHVDNDEYLKYLFAYIHLNPVKLINPKWKDQGGITDLKNTLDYLGHYCHSSFSDYLNKSARPAKQILNQEVFPEYFTTRGEQLTDLIDWLTLENK